MKFRSSFLKTIRQSNGFDCAYFWLRVSSENGQYGRARAVSGGELESAFDPVGLRLARSRRHQFDERAASMDANPNHDDFCPRKEADKVQALDAGANDYLTKPIGCEELMARIRVALRLAPSTESVEQTRFELGIWCWILCCNKLPRPESQ